VDVHARDEKPAPARILSEREQRGVPVVGRAEGREERPRADGLGHDGESMLGTWECATTSPTLPPPPSPLQRRTNETKPCSRRRRRPGIAATAVPSRARRGAAGSRSAAAA